MIFRYLPAAVVVPDPDVHEVAEVPGSRHDEAVDAAALEGSSLGVDQEPGP